MSMPKEETEPLLLSLGFTLESSSGVGDEYSMDLDARWKVTAFAAYKGNPFAGTATADTYERVDFSLDSKGTIHKCFSVKALQSNAVKILDELRRVSENEDLLKCPKCGTRYVHAKEPHPGDKWKPFLSCDGMMVVGRGREKHVACDGISKKLPAVVLYR
jgi:hypothetical protein